MNYNARYKELVDVIQAITGETLNATRRAEQVTMRMCIAYRLICDGASLHKISELMGKDHSTIHFYKCKMGEIMRLPQQYKQELQLFNSFNNIV